MPVSRLNGRGGQPATELTLVHYKQRVVRFCDKVANVYLVRNFERVVRLSLEKKHHTVQGLTNRDLHIQPWEENDVKGILRSCRCPETGQGKAEQGRAGQGKGRARAVCKARAIWQGQGRV